MHRVFDHSEVVSGLAEGIGIQLGVEPVMVDRLRLAGLLHDLGKIGLLALAWLLLAGLVIAPLLGGRWGRLADLRLRLPAVFYVAIALQLVAFPFSTMPWRTPDPVAIVLWLASYGLFAIGTGCNIRLPGVPLVAVGMVSNLAAILTNGGHMPALPSALRAAGLHFQQRHNSKALNSPHLAWLVDRWATPDWLPYGNVFSAGDVLIALGGLVFVLAATGALGRPRLRVLARKPA